MAKKASVYKRRKPALTRERARELARRARAGEKPTALAPEFGISRKTLYQYLRAISSVASRRQVDNDREQLQDLKSSLKTNLREPFEELRTSIPTPTRPNGDLGTNSAAEDSGKRGSIAENFRAHCLRKANTRSCRYPLEPGNHPIIEFRQDRLESRFAGRWYRPKNGDKTLFVCKHSVSDRLVFPQRESTSHEPSRDDREVG